MKDNKINILIAGDYHIYGNYKKVRGKFDNFIKQNPNHKIFDDNLAEIVKDSDLSIFNLEDPISTKKNGILKNGPHGVGSEDSLKPIKEAGFNIATFATNHTYDMGNEGIIETMKACSKFDIDLIGCGLTEKEAVKIYYREINDIRIAILNFSRIEFNQVTETHGGANPLDIVDNTRDIIKAKQNADFVFVVVHEGLDVYHFPYPKLVKQMRFYAEMGADAIIIHHSRIISGYEIYKNTPIFYGIGNIMHLCKNINEHEGLFIQFLIDKGKKLSFDILPVELDTVKSIISLCNENRKKELLKKVHDYSQIIKDTNLLDKEWNKFIELKSSQYLSILSGYPRVFYRIAKKIKLLNVYKRLLAINRKKYLPLLNLLRCQAHLEATKTILDALFKTGDK